MAERAHPEDISFKNKWFGLKKNIYRKKLFERYRFCNPYIKGKVILDIPSGVGWGTSLLNGARMYYGVDINLNAIKYAASHYQNINFQVGNMMELPFKANSFDVIICLEGFEHVSKEIGKKFLLESLRILKLYGLFIMTCPVLNDAGQSSGNPYHAYEYPEKELIELLNQNYRFLLLERIQGPDNPELRFVGQKL